MAYIAFLNIINNATQLQKFRFLVGNVTVIRAIVLLMILVLSLVLLVLVLFVISNFTLDKTYILQKIFQTGLALSIDKNGFSIS